VVTLPGRDSAYEATLGPSVVHELNHARTLANDGSYTEAGLRVGRAVEAGLYSAASELQIDLTNRSIAYLDRIQNALRSAQVTIMRKRTSDEVRSLANVSKNLSEAIAQLAENELLRGGELDDSPRANEQLFRELLQLITDDTRRSHLESHKAVLEIIRVKRNHAAHPALDGSERELAKTDYEELLEGAELFLEALSEAVVGESARQVWAPRNE
jgi:adenine-specific DNA methylase